MALSQNLRFLATIASDPDLEDPPGTFLIRSLATELVANGWTTDEYDNWRDCGWSVACHRGKSSLDVVVSQIPDGEWMLQVSPSRVPFFGAFFGRKPSATPTDIFELAVSVHKVLSAKECLENPRWRWDGFPEDCNSTPEPHPS